jgi:hypothetical protein
MIQLADKMGGSFRLTRSPAYPCSSRFTISKYITKIIRCQ